MHFSLNVLIYFGNLVIFVNSLNLCTIDTNMLLEIKGLL